MEPDKEIHTKVMLKKLPPEKQAEIVARTEAGTNIVAVAAWLTKDGIPATPAMVTRFREWYLLWQELRESEEFADDMTEFCKERGWIKAAREERAAAQMFFNRSVLKKRDPKMWSMVEKINLVKDKVGIEEEKLELQKKKFEDKRVKKKKKALSGKMTDEEKEAAIRQIYGMEPVSRNSAPEKPDGNGIQTGLTGSTG